VVFLTSSTPTTSTTQGHTRDGDVLWEKEIDTSSSSFDGILVDDEFNLYISNGSTLYSIDQDGDLRWEITTNEGSYDGFAVGTERVCAALNDGGSSSFVEIDKDTGNFEEHPNVGYTETRDGSMDQYGNYYQSSAGFNRIAKISPGGVEEWRTTFDSVRDVFVGPDSEYIYVTTSSDSVEKLDTTDGSIIESRTLDSNLNLEYIDNNDILYGYGAYDWDDDEIIWDFTDEISEWSQAQPTPIGKAYAPSSTFNSADDRLIRVYDMASGAIEDTITIQTSDDNSRNNIVVMPNVGPFSESWDIYTTNARTTVSQSSTISTQSTPASQLGNSGVASVVDGSITTSTAGGFATSYAMSSTTQSASSVTQPNQMATTYSTASPTTTLGTSTDPDANSGISVVADYVSSTTTPLLIEVLENILRARKVTSLSSANIAAASAIATPSASETKSSAQLSTIDSFAEASIGAVGGSIESTLSDILATGGVSTIADRTTPTTVTTIVNAEGVFHLSAILSTPTSSITSPSAFTQSFPQASQLDVIGVPLTINPDATAGSTASPITATTSTQTAIQFVSRNLLIGESSNSLAFSGRAGNSVEIDYSSE